MAEILKEELQRMKIASKMADFLLGSAHCPERLFALTFSLQVGGASEGRLCPSWILVSPPRDPMEPGPLRGGRLCSTEAGAGVGVVVVGMGGGCRGVVGEGDKFVPLAWREGVPLQHHVTTFTSASVYRFIINED